MKECRQEHFGSIRRKVRKPEASWKDWKEAERDLLGAMPVDLAETGENFYALASVPGYAAAEISVAVEDCWLLISGYGHSFTSLEAGASGVEFDALGVTKMFGEPKVGASDRNACEPLDTQGTARGECFEDCVVRRPFCVVELRQKVDPARSIAVVANGMVAVRMAKASSDMPRKESIDRARGSF